MGRTFAEPIFWDPLRSRDHPRCVNQMPFRVFQSFSITTLCLRSIVSLFARAYARVLAHIQTLSSVQLSPSAFVLAEKDSSTINTPGILPDGILCRGVQDVPMEKVRTEDNKTGRWTVLFLLMALAILPGCQRRPLEYPTSNINLRLDLHLNVVINGKVENLPEPEMMRVIFFDPNTYDLYTESYLPATGGRISIPPGTYKLMAYNFDTEATLLRNDRNFYTIEAYTNEVSAALKANLINALRNGKSATTRAEGDGDSAWESALEKMAQNPVIYEPDHLFVSREDVVINSTDEEQVIEASAETIIETWEISVRIKNGEYLSSARALITGQIASNFIGYPKEEGKTDTDVTLMIEMKAGSDAEDNDILVGQFTTFGKNPSADSRLWLAIIVKNSSGETVEYHKDITGDFMSDEAITDQIISIVEEIEVPEPDPGTGGGGGFQPGVDDWEHEDVPIDI